MLLMVRLATELSMRALPSLTKVQPFCIIVLSTLLYGYECLTVLDKRMHQLEVFQMRRLGFKCGVPCVTINQSNAQIRLEWHEPPSIVTKLRFWRLSWLGHLDCMTNDRLPKQLLFSQTVSNRRLPGFSRKKWHHLLQADLKPYKDAV